MIAGDASCRLHIMTQQNRETESRDQFEHLILQRERWSSDDGRAKTKLSPHPSINDNGSELVIGQSHSSSTVRAKQKFFHNDVRHLMMMDAAVVENCGIVPGDIPASHMGLRLPALLSP
ncbi:hypothetical protein JOB18_042481 [Solea senegalensis]|uniref:Uncharacterized protein n=1 Tax=Solea senegalensis TaxID=28829 RepID=A0AAV6PT60_SOLSE|nr:hypothetical protein JOB18_042481 [Solea senegalensis]